MATQKQIAANRENAKRSTGPRTEQGKRICRMNALKHGIDSREELSCGESPVELHELAAEYDHEFQPVGLAERVLVDLLIRKDWLMRRHAFLQADLTNYGVLIASKTKDGNEYGSGFTQNLDANNRLHRHMVDTERAYFRYLEELEHRQADRRRHQGAVDASATPSSEAENAEIGSVSQASPDRPRRIPDQPSAHLKHLSPLAQFAAADPGSSPDCDPPHTNEAIPIDRK
uniref:Uncharacterized protein n=1 Tax=Solibacter usitatus (strain Ellin6076) TaxID=234267 RepID=Q025G8_SOLUE